MTGDTYWFGKGKYQVLSDALDKTIPRMGPLPNAKERPCLEALRRANNAYYDLYNNGGGNLDGDILRISGVDPTAPKGAFHGPRDFDEDAYDEILAGHDPEEVKRAFEPVMDRLIMEAAEEQILRLKVR